MDLLVSILPLLLLLFSVGTAQEDDSEIEYSPVIATKSGPIRGRLVRIADAVTYSYSNIPYAEPPIGELRFKRPQPKKPWSETLDAVEQVTCCMQNHFTVELKSEDCLFLKIVTPVKIEKGPLPVMVWIHGGGFLLGCSEEQDGIYGSWFLSAYNNVIVVSVNYRLGVFGFLSAPGVEINNGLWDQRLAFQWINENIDAFGGDPNRITLFGESAGGMSISYHIMNGLSDGLFQRAIIQSSPTYVINERITEGVSSPHKLTCFSNRVFHLLGEEKFSKIRGRCRMRSGRRYTSVPTWYRVPGYSE